MNLELGILWIEDTYEPEEEENLRRRVRERGFVPSITVIPNGEDLAQLARKHEMFHCYDIILLDFRLKGQSGDDLAPEIRKHFPSTTILFYSGTIDEADLRRRMAEKQVEGVYCSARQRFIDRTGALIEQTARSLDRLSGMRGLAMRIVAECDGVMTEAIKAMSARDQRCANLLTELDADVLKFLSERKERYEALADGDLEARLATRSIDSAKLFSHFRRLTKVVTTNHQDFGLDDIQVDRLRELRQATAQYSLSVLEKRNILGHVVEVETESGWALQGSSDITVADFPEIRRVFALHLDAFRELSSLVAPIKVQ